MCREAIDEAIGVLYTAFPYCTRKTMKTFTNLGKNESEAKNRRQP